MYIKRDFSPVLHSFAYINNNKCKIWHQSQHLACQRCCCRGNHTSETKKCDAFIEDPEVITIKSPQYVFCNYYPSPLKVFETEFASSEHTYQWRFLKHRHDILAQHKIWWDDIEVCYTKYTHTLLKGRIYGVVSVSEFSKFDEHLPQNKIIYLFICILFV